MGHQVRRVRPRHEPLTELLRPLDDLRVRIGLTFRAGITNRRAAGVLQGGIMAFGNRLLPCTLRKSGGRPLAGGHEKHRGEVRSPAGGKTALFTSKRQNQWPVAGRRCYDPGRFEKPSSTVGDRTVIQGN